MRLQLRELGSKAASSASGLVDLEEEVDEEEDIENAVIAVASSEANQNVLQLLVSEQKKLNERMELLLARQDTVADRVEAMQDTVADRVEHASVAAAQGQRQNSCWRSCRNKLSRR